MGIARLQKDLRNKCKLEKGMYCTVPCTAGLCRHVTSKTWLLRVNRDQEKTSSHPRLLGALTKVRRHTASNMKHANARTSRHFWLVVCLKLQVVGA